MIPDEEDIREYARYAARVREIVQEEVSKYTGKIDPNILGEISRSATMPIGIWVEQRGHQLNYNSNHMSAEEAKVEVEKLFARFDLVENGGYVRPRKGLSHDDFITLKNMFLELGYRYEQGKGFVKGRDMQVK
jgi:hypothetical protein